MIRPTHQEAVDLLYRLAARGAHPDTGGATDLMVRVNAAADVLRGCRGVVLQISHRPPAADERLTFGKHRGARLADVPLDYLAWCADNLKSQTWRKSAAAVLQWRSPP